MQNKRPHVQSGPPADSSRTTAAAIRYDQDKNNAPEVLAAGMGKTAEKIIELARENGIPVYEDPVLASALSKVNPGEEIPPELYALVAEVLAFIYKTYRTSSSPRENGRG